VGSSVLATATADSTGFVHKRHACALSALSLCAAHLHRRRPEQPNFKGGYLRDEAALSRNARFRPGWQHRDGCGIWLGAKEIIGITWDRSQIFLGGTATDVSGTLSGGQAFTFTVPSYRAHRLGGRTSGG
jgi:hypothetical protein